MDNNKKIRDLRNMLFVRLSEFYPIKWHTSKHGSRYIKFRDTRLGSIRISDHNSRSWYGYTFEIDINNYSLKDIEEIHNKIIEKSKEINNFNGENYVVYSNKMKKYVTIDSYKEYKNAILKKNI